MAKKQETQFKIILAIVIIALFVYFIYKMVLNGGEKFKHNNSLKDKAKNVKRYVRYHDCSKTCSELEECKLSGHSKSECRDKGLPGDCDCGENPVEHCARLCLTCKYFGGCYLPSSYCNKTMHCPWILP